MSQSATQSATTASSARPGVPVKNEVADMKRKWADTTVDTVASAQPVESGSGAGRELMAQVVHAVDWLKAKDRPVSFEDIWGYLSLSQDQQQHKSSLRQVLIKHPKVEFSTTGFRFRPPHPVRSAEELKGYLQKRSTAQGLNVAELKEGWPGAVAAIDAMDEAGDLLVTRHKKDNSPRVVWNNDRTLSHHVDEDFRVFWSKKLKEPEDMRTELEKAGLTPTSQIKEMVPTAGAREKKRRINRKIGKTTNVHMMGILKDYSNSPNNKR